MNIFIVADSSKHFSSAIEEYKKRLGKNLAIFAISPEKYGDIKKIKEKETQKIIEALKKHPGYTILLDVEGKTKDTLSLSSHLEKIQQEHKDINWIIGGAYWVDRNTLSHSIHESFSLSALTFAHSLALLVLVEQIYRVHTIQNNIPYHHA